MLFTEQEAKDRACCGTFWRKGPDGVSIPACVASQCMAWRWANSGRPVYSDAAVIGNEDVGYCGFVGKPE